MWNLAKIVLIVVASLSVVERAQGQPFVHFSISREPLSLGMIAGPGKQKLEAHLTARVVANCPYHVEAGFRALVHESGQSGIPPANLRVVINGTTIPVGGSLTPVASSRIPTPRAGVDVPIDVDVEVAGAMAYPAGRYCGTLTIKVMAGL